MKKQDQDYDFQLLLKRLGIIFIVALLAFGAVKFMKSTFVTTTESNRK